jgi:Uncharacterized protein conserved in bacteria (DUF2252)
VVGDGSAGSQEWIVLMLGIDDHDPLILQAKRSKRLSSSGSRARAGPEPRPTRGGGPTPRAGHQRIFLGWDRITDVDGARHDYSVPLFCDWKGSVEIDSLRPAGLVICARLCGWTLARAHARSGDRVAVPSYLGKSAVFDRADRRVLRDLRRSETRLRAAAAGSD